MLFSIAIVILLMGLLIGGLRLARRVANKAADQTAVAGLVMACEQFKHDFGFPPPLVQDNWNNETNQVDENVYIGQPLKSPTDGRVGPISSIHPNDPGDKTYDPVTFLSTTDQAQRFLFREEPFMRGRKQAGDVVITDRGDYRFSRYSLAYYLLGVLGNDPTGASIDGVEGAGFLAPNADGTFRKTGGKKYQPLFDTSKGSISVVPVDAAAGRFELRDRNGVPFRYYMWKQGAEKPPGKDLSLVVEKVDDLNVPLLVGDPASDPSVRNAEYAIVAAGANGVFGDWWSKDRHTEAPSFIKQGVGVSDGVDDDRAARMGREDNIVGVGR